MNLAARSRTAVKRTLRRSALHVGRIRRSGGDGSAPRILCYHGVCDAPPDEWSVTPAQLREQMKVVASEWTPVSLTAIVDWLRGGQPVPSRAVAVTFDDGFADVLETAAPILADAGVPGTSFVAPDLISGRSNDPSYIPSRPMMTWTQVEELAAQGWCIGSHSLTHPQLATLEAPEARRQLTVSKDVLEQRLGTEITMLAYPYGTAHTVSARDRELAREAGYHAAFMDMTGSLSLDDDRMALPRTKVLGTDSMPVVRGSLQGSMDVWRWVESHH